MVEILVSMFVAFAVIWALIMYAYVEGRLGAWPVVLLFIFTMVIGGLWVTPVSPPLVDVYGVPFLFVAIFIALFSANIPSSPRRKGRRRSRLSLPALQAETSATPNGLRVLFWLLLVGLTAVALFRYAVFIRSGAPTS